MTAVVADVKQAEPVGLDEPHAEESVVLVSADKDRVEVPKRVAAQSALVLTILDGMSERA
jgi:hypothetical protein